MRNIVFCLLICRFLGLNAQEWVWTHHFNFEFTEKNSSIGGVDEDGNVYLTLLNYSEIKHKPGGGYRLLKINRAGQLVWEKNINHYSQGRITTDLPGRSYITCADKLVCLDKEGNEIWKINTYGIRNFGKVKVKENFLFVDGREHVSGDSTIGFVSSYTNEGNLVSTTYYNVNKFALVDFEPGSELWEAHDVFPDPNTLNRGKLIKYDSQGNSLFSREIPYPNKIIGDYQGSVFVNGEYADPIELDGKKYSSPINSFNNYQFIAKYSTTGELLWYKIIEGTLGNSRMICDKSGNLIYVVEYSYSIKINNEYENKPGPQMNFLCMKWDKDGNILYSWETPGTKGRISPQSIFVHNDDVYISAWMTGEMQFGNTLVQTSSNMYSELFVGKISQRDLVGLRENANSARPWTIFPNPSGDIFSLRGETVKAADFSVTNTQGQLILAGSFKGVNQNIDLSAFAPGVYLLQIKSGESIETRKLVKN